MACKYDTSDTDQLHMKLLRQAEHDLCELKKSQEAIRVWSNPRRHDDPLFASSKGEVSKSSKNPYHLFRLGYDAFKGLSPELSFEQMNESIQLLCRMYDYIVFFKTRDIAKSPWYLKTVSKIQKRKIELMKKLLLFCPDKTEVKIQLGSFYCDILDTKLKIFERSSDNLEPRLLQKMAYIVRKGQQCLKDLIDVNENQVDLEVTAMAHYYTAILNNRFFTPCVSEQRKATLAAINHYEKVIELAELDDNVARALVQEVNKAIDTSDLLRRQLKMSKLA